MSFRPDKRPPIQDMPPPGGFPPIDILKKARVRGPSGTQLWIGSTLIICYGFYRVGLNNREKSLEFLEERKARYALAAVLQAEENIWYCQREDYIIQQENEIMKKTYPEWNAAASPYITNRWVPRRSWDLDRNTKK